MKAVAPCARAGAVRHAVYTLVECGAPPASHGEGELSPFIPKVRREEAARGGMLPEALVGVEAAARLSLDMRDNHGRLAAPAGSCCGESLAAREDASAVDGGVLRVPGEDL